MKIALVSLNDSTDVHQWSGLNYFIARSLERAGATIHRIGPLESRWTTAMRLRQRWYSAVGRTYHAVIEPSALDSMGAAARAQIPGDADAVLSVTSLVAAAVGKLAKPHVSWDDATNAAMEQYYPDFHRMAGITRAHSMALGHRAAEAVDLAIYASEWAAESAHAAYRLGNDRVAVVPFGANLDVLPDQRDVDTSIAARSTDELRLLWVGVDWQRKGGPLTLDIARRLRDRGALVELTLVGCEPPKSVRLPEWVRLEGFISKREAAGRERLAALFARSHFFVMPSSAEAYGLVYAEASAFGVPSVAIRTGGVPTIVVHGETGLLFDPSADADDYASRVLALFLDRDRYAGMASAARRRAVERLNWDVAGRYVVWKVESLVKGRNDRTER